jgi:protein MpaA
MRFDVSGQPSAALVARFHSLALRSDFLARRPLPLSLSTQLEQFIFEGPHGGGDPIRIALFAGIHGDEPAGSDALLNLAENLVAKPDLAEGYNLHFYPICNPTGFDARSRFSSSGKDLNREFWRNSLEPEVVLLEREIHQHRFHGLVSLHSDDTSTGLYGFVRGAVLARSLLEPALQSAERILPRNESAEIDGFAAERGIISECYDGILTSPPKLENSPFEIIFETPHHAPAEKQVQAFVVAILSILAEYRKFIAFAAVL